MSRIVRQTQERGADGGRRHARGSGDDLRRRDVADRRRHGHPSRRVARRAARSIGERLRDSQRRPDRQLADRRRRHGAEPLRHHRSASSAPTRAVGPFAHLRTGASIGATRQGRQLRRAEEDRARRRLEGDAPQPTSATRSSAPSVNIGAGTITCNYDGTHKQTTTIEDGAFIGSDSQLIAPVTVGEDAYVGTGTTIRENVPAGALAVSAGKQRNIEGWVERRRKSAFVKNSRNSLIPQFANS